MKNDPVQNLISSDLPVAVVPLANRLTLEIFDRSRKIAGDRWQVRLTARVAIPLAAITKEQWDRSGVEPRAAENRFGPVVVFEKCRERNFVDEAQRKSVFREMRTSFESSLKEYLSHPDFAVQVVRRRYGEALRKAAWHRG